MVENIQFPNNRSYLNNNLPVWINRIVDDDINRYLYKNESKVFTDLQTIYQAARIDPEANCIFNLALAVMEHNRRIRFLENAISDQCHEMIKLRGQIRELKIIAGVNIDA